VFYKIDKTYRVFSNKFVGLLFKPAKRVAEKIKAHATMYGLVLYLVKSPIEQPLLNLIYLKIELKVSKSF
jgi:hypothetical protein